MITIITIFVAIILTIVIAMSITIIIARIIARIAAIITMLVQEPGHACHLLLYDIILQYIIYYYIILHVASNQLIFWKMHRPKYVAE